MSSKESLDPGGFVGREIVSDDVDLLARRLAGDDLGEKGDEFLASVTGHGLAQHLATAGIERGIKRQGAVAVVFKSMPFQAAGRQRQHRVEPIQRLNGGLLVHAKHHRMLRWVDYRAITSAALVSKSGSSEAM